MTTLLIFVSAKFVVLMINLTERLFLYWYEMCSQSLKIVTMISEQLKVNYKV